MNHGSKNNLDLFESRLQTNYTMPICTHARFSNLVPVNFNPHKGV